MAPNKHFFHMKAKLTVSKRFLRENSVGPPTSISFDKSEIAIILVMQIHIVWSWSSIVKLKSSPTRDGIYLFR